MVGVLEQYIKVGVGALDRAKLPQLLELKYHAVCDAVAELGNVGSINELLIGFQKYLYTCDRAASITFEKMENFQKSSTPLTKNDDLLYPLPQN